MKVIHWSLKNGSGMHRVSENIMDAEKALGIDSHHVDCSAKSEEWDKAVDADVHVVHTHLPDVLKKQLKHLRIVWVAHGTPNHVIQSSIEAGAVGYGHSDSLMLMQHWLRNADARVTFWPRHQWIYQRMVDKGITVHHVPLGVDREFWADQPSRGKYQGEPSVWTGENPHWIKWPLDLYTIWPAILEEFPLAKLHSVYMPRDMHRWVFPFVNANGASYGAHISAQTWPHDELRSVFKSIDFFIGLVRYGDFNQLQLQASAAGATVISYRGNEYADYWMTEGDERMMAKDLIAILKGDVPKREKSPVPHIRDTAKAMIQIYEQVAA